MYGVGAGAGGGVEKLGHGGSHISLVCYTF